MSSTYRPKSLARRLSLASANSLSVAMETNGKGCHGFIVELPGAYIRGPTEQEALSKTRGEAQSYLRWLGQENTRFSEPTISQTHRSGLMIEDADSAILLLDDTNEMSDRDFQQLVELARYSGITFHDLYDSVELKDRIDKARIRKTFYGPNKKTIQEIFDHVMQTQYYYLSRTGTIHNQNKAESFMAMRDSSLNTLQALFKQNRNSKIYNVDDEEWTLTKVLRRFVWHDRIHGKAITRILETQRQLNLIEEYEDPFRFDVRLKRS